MQPLGAAGMFPGRKASEEKDFSSELGNGARHGALYSPEYAVHVPPYAGPRTESTGVGQGELYSPMYAKDIKEDAAQSQRKASPGPGEQDRSPSAVTAAGKTVIQATKAAAADVADNIALMSDKLQEKFAAVPSLPAEVMEIVRRTLDSTMYSNVYGTARAAVQRAKEGILDMLPGSVSPADATQARAIVEDVEREVLLNPEAAASADAERGVVGGPALAQALQPSALRPAVFFVRSRL